MNRINTGDKTMYQCARTGHRIEPLPINHCLPGMGVSTVSAARILRGQMEGGSGEETMLAMDTFPYVALSKVTRQSCCYSSPTPPWTAPRNSDEHGQQGMTWSLCVVLCWLLLFTFFGKKSATKGGKEVSFLIWVVKVLEMLVFIMLHELYDPCIAVLPPTHTSTQ